MINRSLEKVKREKKRDDGQAKEAGPGPISEDMVGEQKKDPFTDSLKADLPEEQVQQQNERQTGPVPTPPEKQAESPRETPPPA